ncbi:MAG: DUF721 domain-containing protein [Spirochaetales bacterium]|nr:DUF721 domain-containing protein [Spirochaetales bacterium]
MDDSRVKKASDLVSALVSPKAARMGEGWQGFFSAWSELAGERVAAHSRIADVDKGIVVVEADHPGWIQTLQFSQARILAELKRRYPNLGLRGISFRNATEGRGARSEAMPPSVAERNAAAWSKHEQPETIPENSEGTSERILPEGELGMALERLRAVLGGSRSD